MPMRSDGLLLAVALCGVVPLLAEVVPVDVGEWARIGTGETADGWTVGGIDAYSDGAVRFDKKDDFALSPVFPGVVTQIVMNVRSSSANATRFLAVEPVVAREGASGRMTTASMKLVDQTLGWAEDDGVRQIRLGLEGTGSTAWGVRTLTVWLDDRVVPPLGRYEETSHSDAVVFGWNPEPRAVAYEIEASRLAVSPPCKVWDFTILTNTTGNTRSLAELNPPPELSEVAGTGLCLQGKEGGYLQIGNTEKGGTMALPLALATNRVVVANMFSLATDGDVVAYPGFVASDGATNALASVHLATNSLAYSFSIPSEASLFLLASSKGDDRIRVESVTVSPGSLVTNVLPLVLTARSRKMLRNLSSGDWLWRVRSLAPDGSRSDWSPYRDVRLDPQAPPFGARGCMLRLR